MARLVSFRGYFTSLWDYPNHFLFSLMFTGYTFNLWSHVIIVAVIIIIFLLFLLLFQRFSNTGRGKT